MKHLWHLLFWIFYCLFEAFISAKLLEGFGSLTTNVYMWSLCVTLITLPTRLIFAYVLVNILIPKYFEQKRRIAKGIFLFAMLFVSMLFLYRISINFIAWPIVFDFFPGFDIFDWGLTSLSITRTLAPVALLTVGSLIVERHAQQLRLERFKKSKLESELQSLKAQIQPHFLFNTLNNIYALAHSKSDQTAPAVAALSRLLRFVLFESGKELTPIASEVNILNEYIKLEKLRYGDKLKMQFDQNIENNNQMISPLLLLPLVENAFKHGASESIQEPKIHCSISERNGCLDFWIKNTINDNDETESFGLGLENLKRQLSISYPDRHKLTISKANKHFLAKLTLSLK